MNWSQEVRLTRGTFAVLALVFGLAFALLLYLSSEGFNRASEAREALEGDVDRLDKLEQPLTKAELKRLLADLIDAGSTSDRRRALAQTLRRLRGVSPPQAGRVRPSPAPEARGPARQAPRRQGADLPPGAGAPPPAASPPPARPAPDSEIPNAPGEEPAREPPLVDLPEPLPDIDVDLELRLQPLLSAP